MSTVAQTLGVTLPQITALTNKLLALKIVRQKTQTHDRRSRHIVPTGKGKSLVEDTEDILSKAYKAWLKEVPVAQYGQYLSTVEWLADNRPPSLPALAAPRNQRAYDKGASR